MMATVLCCLSTHTASSTLTLQSSGALTIDTTAAASPIAIGTTTSQDVSIGHGSSVVAVSADTMTVAGTTSLALDAPSVSVGVNTAAATPALALGKSTTAMTINADTVAATMTSTFALDAPDVTINTSPANSVIIGSADLTTLTACAFTEDHVFPPHICQYSLCVLHKIRAHRLARMYVQYVFCMCTDALVYIPTYVCTLSISLSLSLTHTHTPTHVHTYPYAHTHTRTHTYVRFKHTHIHVYICGNT